MKNIGKLLIVNNSELASKWWHRLSKVLIYGSTLIFAIILAVNFYSNIFQDFSRINPCKFGCTNEYLIQIYSSRTDLDSEKNKSNYSNPPETISSDQIRNIMLERNNRYVELSTDNLISKSIKEIIVLWLKVVVWFVFWESVVYRSIIYIIYGKNK